MKTYKQIIAEAKKVSIDINWASEIKGLDKKLLEGFVNEEKEVTLKVDFDIGKKDKKNWKALGIKAVVKYDAVQSLTGTKEALIKYYTKISGWRKEDVIDQYPELK